MQKVGGRGRGSFQQNFPERSGLGAVDVIAIVVVIVLLIGTLGGLVASRVGRGTHPTAAWVAGLAESVADWLPRSESEETNPSSSAAR